MLLLIRRMRHFFAVVNTFIRGIPRAVSFYDGSLQLTIRRIVRVLMREGLSGVMRRANILMQGSGLSSQFMLPHSDELYGKLPSPDPDFLPKVSVIVPNFNHAKYLAERLDSIYKQTYPNIEVILLDDCSDDESVSILRDYAARFSEKSIICFNQTNSGGVFNQWKKGLELATGELVWIAESDDFCSLNLLDELVRCFRNPAVMLAFARTEFVRGTPPVTVWASEDYLSDLGLDSWAHPFIESAHQLVKSGWATKNLIPNVSSVLFRNPGEMRLLTDSQWLNLQICGDWVFYLSIIRGGLVTYNPGATNYYRQHNLNTSVAAQKEDLYYREFETVARYLTNLFRLERSDIEGQEQHLYTQWCRSRGESQLAEFRALYNLDRIWQDSANRKPNLVMAIYALTAGGGETFPILLANLLHARGYAVTVLNCNEQKTQPGVRRMLCSIPLLELDRFEYVNAIFTNMGIELVHSHHAWVDVKLATHLINNKDVQQIVSMHGMYEMMTPAQLKNLLPLLKRRVSCFVYTAEKNLSPFSESFRQMKRFCQIDNALPQSIISPLSRADLNVGSDDFLLCMVARAIPEKGWEEAKNAVVWANANSERNIHLLLIGEGPELDRLQPQTPQAFIHFLGFRSNIRDYFAVSDMGFLPSRFKGESFPLVIIDCLYSGRPVLASNVGEICKMLMSEEGPAGQLFDLQDGVIPVESVGRIISNLANDDASYQTLLRRVLPAAAKFEADSMVDKYEAVYRESLELNTNNP